MDLSYQLYSARNEASLDETLRQLRHLGYTQVEGWGGQFGDPPALAASLVAAGLKMPTAHLGFKDLGDVGRVIEIARTVGIGTIYCPSRPHDYGGSWTDFAGEMARIGRDLGRAGLGFGYHNHAFEFKTLPEGQPMAVLLDAAPDLQWEMDVAWLVKGGEDPLAWMDRFGDRITALHVKDMAPEGEALDEDGWADVGFGTMDWTSLAEAARSKTKVKYFVAEHDKPSDAIRFARRSIDSVRTWM